MNLCELPEDMNVAEAARHLMATKYAEKKLSEQKSAATGSLNQELRETRKDFLNHEKELKEREQVLKGIIISEYDDCLGRQQKAQEKAEAAFLKDDLDAVHAHMMQACESELKLPYGVSVRRKLNFAVEDKTLVPPDLLQIDALKVRTLMKRYKESTKIPGLKFFFETSVAADAREYK